MTRINSINEMEAIPFKRNVVEAAYRLKSNGLPWSPRVGCFVWDRHAVLPMPSPFPERVYFVLSMRRFLHYFDTVANMREKLVWVPTLYQALGICHAMDIRTENMIDLPSKTAPRQPELFLLRLYDRIGGALRRGSAGGTASSESMRVSTDEDWIRLALRHEIGPMEDLPANAARRVWSAYLEAGRAYLGWRRIQEGKPDDWYPARPQFGAEIMHELKHFYSDYQRVVKDYERMRDTVLLLRSVDAQEHPLEFEGIVASLEADDNRSSDADIVMGQVLSNEDERI